MDICKIIKTEDARIAVVGCGGKSSLINLLAKENRHKKVLIMPTTKIAIPCEKSISLCQTAAQCLAHKPHQGLQCLGVLHKQAQKFTAPPKQLWQGLAKGYNLVLMEADGSRGLPCKGWNCTEPLVPNFATQTVGLITLLGKWRPADENTVHRLLLFCQLSGLAKGQIIGTAALASMVTSPLGMFKNAIGSRVLLINQVESTPALKDAKELASLIKKTSPNFAGFIFAGSVFENKWTMV